LLDTTDRRSTLQALVERSVEDLAGPFDVSELRQIPTEDDTSPTIRVRTDGSSRWQVTVVAAPLG
jgi:hypothetical protein